jgi:hypothetical protein
MTLHSTPTTGKHYRPARTTFPEPNVYAVRWILDRYDVSPSLARTIAGLASLGGR